MDQEFVDAMKRVAGGAKAELEKRQQQREEAKKQMLALPSASAEKAAHPERLARHELIQLVKDMAVDWETLNGFLNGRAVAQGWCGTYEENQKVYNKQFKVFKLAGRPEMAETSQNWPARTGYTSYGGTRPL